MRSLKLRSSSSKDAVTQIAGIIDAAGAQLRNGEVAAGLIGYESANSETRTMVDMTCDALINKLKTTNYVRNLYETSRGDDKKTNSRQDQIDIAVESAAAAIIASLNRDSVRNMIKNQSQFTVPNGMAVVDGQIFGISKESEMGYESFDPYVDTQYIALQAAALILSSIETDFKSTFFNPVPVAPGQSGIDFDINIQRVWKGQTRDASGKAVNFQREKIIKALIDPSFLENDFTVIVPYASSATDPVYLVPEAVIPAWTHTIKDIPVPTRPILFNLAADNEVDLIAVSNASGLITTGVFDQTDQLDPVVNVGTVYFKVTATDGAGSTFAILEFDMTNQPGSLFIPRVEAQRQDYYSVMDAHLIINEKVTAKVGDVTALVTKLGSALTVPSGEFFSVVAVAKITSRVNIDTARFSSDCAQTGILIDGAYDKNGLVLDKTKLNSNGVTVTIEPIGVLPLCRRTNSNLRLRGTIVDDTVVNRYRLPLRLGQPFITMRPVNTEARTTVESLAQVVNVRNEAAAVNAFLQAEKYIDSIKNLPSNSINPVGVSMIGSEFYIKPTLLKSRLDVGEMVQSLGSNYALQNLNGQLRAALTELATEMLVQSNYYAALRYVTGTDTGYEIIMVTDPQIATYIWESGDDRTLGNLQNYVITKHINQNFRGKIRMSVRRLNRPEPHPIDFGVQLIGVPVTQEITLQSNGATFTENRFIPNTTFWPTLPVMATMEVVGLETFFADNLVQ